ncbi:MAG: DNA starvation/stationary phase protection protein Dps [Planctomycetota bacterium]|nr:MAG: DNA starvation/stationary phase protection protein Dps [Planctomycetota bacterium]GDY10619.1 DNA starvation/stationary phase protection protein [Planctomycetia bacterium]
MQATKNDLSELKRIPLAVLLNQALAELIDLQLQAKQAHWNVKGPNFIALHELFDTVSADAAAFADSVAERITALGGQAEGTINVVGRRTTLRAYPVEIVAGRDHVEALSTSMAVVGKSIRSSIDRAVELGDADTADLFTEISRGLDKKLWFVESHLHGNA